MSARPRLARSGAVRPTLPSTLPSALAVIALLVGVVAQAAPAVALAANARPGPALAPRAHSFSAHSIAARGIAARGQHGSGHGTAHVRQRNATFGIGPGTAKGLDQQRSSLNYQMDPGAQLADHVALVNLGTKPLRVAVYAADAKTTANGAIGYGSRAEPGTDARRWIDFGASGRTSLTVALKPRSVTSVPISIRPPSNATPGDHLVGIFAAVTSRADVQGRTGGAPKVEQRVALRTFLRVSGALRSQLSVRDLQTSYHGTDNPVGTGSLTVGYTVVNNGNVSLGGRQALDVTGLFGSTGSTTKLAQIPVLLPGSSYPVTVSASGVRPEIFMHAKVTVTPLGVAGAVDPDLNAASSSTSFYAVPWLLIAVLFLLVDVVVAWLVWRRKHPANARHRPGPSRVPVAAGKA